MAERTTREAALLALPALGFLLGIVVLPLFLLFPLAFTERGAQGDIEFVFSLSNLTRVLGFGSFGYSPDTLVILLRSFALALATTLSSLFLSFPLAFWIKEKDPRRRPLYFALLLVPSSVNLVIRTSGWLVLLGSTFPLAKWLTAVGVVHAGLVPGRSAVTLGMVSAMLPYAALPLISAVEKLDSSLADAARDLHASEALVFFHTILPQLRPALVVASTLVFVPSLGMFLVTDLLGGAKEILIGNLVQLEFGAASDWPYGAMLGLVLVLATMAALVLIRRFGGGLASREFG